MEILLKDNARAAEAFAAKGFSVEKEKIYPVMLARTGVKNKTNLCLVCWKLKDNNFVLLRADTAEFIYKPAFSFCRNVKLFEGFVFDDGTYLNLSLFSLEKGKIEFDLGRNVKVIYRRIIEADYILKYEEIVKS